MLGVGEGLIAAWQGRDRQGAWLDIVGGIRAEWSRAIAETEYLVRRSQSRGVVGMCFVLREVGKGRAQQKVWLVGIWL